MTPRVSSGWSNLAGAVLAGSESRATTGRVAVVSLTSPDHASVIATGFGADARWEWVELSDAARAVELASLQSSFDDACHGHSRCSLIAGPDGAGKTWLLDRLAELADPRALVLRTAGHRDEHQLSYAALDRLIRPLLDRRGELADSRRYALERALRLVDGPAADPFATAAAALDLLVERAVGGPVVVLVDDAQWIDEATRRVLVFASHRLDADRVMIVVAQQTESRTFLPEDAQRIDLGALPAGAAAELVRARHPNIAHHVVERLVHAAAGLPRALVLFADSLTERQRIGLDPVPPVFSLPERLASMYRPTIRELSADSRLALAIAALGDLDAGELAESLDAAGLAADALTPAEVAGLVSAGPLGVSLDHPMVRSAVIDEVPFAVRRRARQAILAALPDGSPRRAEHLGALQSGPDEKVAAAFDQVARDAWHRGGFAEAAHAWTVAADRSTDDAAARSRRDRAVNAALSAGNMREAARLVRQLLAVTSDRAERIGLLHRLVLATYLDDDPRAVDPVEDEAAALLESAPDAASLFGPLLLAHVTYGDYRRAVALADRVRAATPTNELGVAMRVYCDVADVIAARPGSGRVLLADWATALDDHQLLPPHLLISPTLTVMAMAGAADTALRIADRALTAGGDPSRPSTQVLLRGGRAYVLMAVGRWAEAWSECSAAVGLAAASDLTRLGGYLRLLRAQLAAAMGRTAEMHADLAAAASLPERRRSVAEPLTRGQHDLALGNAGAAAAHLAAARRAAADHGLAEPSFVPMLADHVEALWLLDRADELEADVAEFERRAIDLRRPLARAMAERCRALMAPAGEFDETFARATDLHPCWDRFERARTQLAWGRRLRRDQRLGAARAPLSAARDLFGDLGAAPWERTAIAELEACGVPAVAPPAGRERNVNALTAREREVATAAAAGHSNADIAVKLFVSRRTVEYHLANAFTKLGVNRRGDLRELLSSLRDDS